MALILSAICNWDFKTFVSHKTLYKAMMLMRFDGFFFIQSWRKTFPIPLTIVQNRGKGLGETG